MRRHFKFGALYAIAVAVTLWASTPALSAGDAPGKDVSAPPRTPETGIDPGIQVDPGPSPDPHTAVPPKTNPDPGMAINPDVQPGSRPKLGMPSERNAPPNAQPDSAPEKQAHPKKQQ